MWKIYRQTDGQTDRQTDNRQSRKAYVSFQLRWDKKGGFTTFIFDLEKNLKHHPPCALHGYSWNLTWQSRKDICSGEMKLVTHMGRWIDKLITIGHQQSRVLKMYWITIIFFHYCNFQNTSTTPMTVIWSSLKFIRRSGTLAVGTPLISITLFSGKKLKILLLLFKILINFSSILKRNYILISILENFINKGNYILQSSHQCVITSDKPLLISQVYAH